MPDDDIPQNVSAWIGDDTEKRDLVREFDRVVRPTSTGTYSRSDELWEAIRLRIDVEKALARKGFGDLSPHEKRATVRQALLDHVEDVVEDGE